MRGDFGIRPISSTDKQSEPITYISLRVALADIAAYSTSSMKPELCAIYIDMGTTNTRGWLMRGDQVVAASMRDVGVRNAAQSRSPFQIQHSLRELITTLSQEAQEREHPCTPVCVAAAGMIGSSLGLVEVPHLPAPAGIEELSAASRWWHFPNVTELPILLVPGVRSGLRIGSAEDVHELDVMRGEETLCAGLIAAGAIVGPAVVLNLGSHWKAIKLDQDGRISSSATSLPVNWFTRSSFIPYSRARCLQKDLNNCLQGGSKRACANNAVRAWVARCSASFLILKSRERQKTGWPS